MRAEVDSRLAGLAVISVWMIVHTDGANMASESKATMQPILDVPHKAWIVNEVDLLYMLGVQHLLAVNHGIWKMEHKMPLYIIGLDETSKEWLALGGWEFSNPITPAPIMGADISRSTYNYFPRGNECSFKTGIHEPMWRVGVANQNVLSRVFICGL